MIIVSQDKKTISNFNNILGLQIEEHIKDNDGDKDYEIKVVTEKRVCNIGIYETEERAKEVLQEIITEYKEIDVEVEITGSNKQRAVIELPIIKPKVNHFYVPKVYEMPKE